MGVTKTRRGLRICFDHFVLNSSYFICVLLVVILIAIVARPPRPPSPLSSLPFGNGYISPAAHLYK